MRRVFPVRNSKSIFIQLEICVLRSKSPRSSEFSQDALVWLTCSKNGSTAAQNFGYLTAVFRLYGTVTQVFAFKKCLSFENHTHIQGRLV